MTVRDVSWEHVKAYAFRIRCKLAGCHIETKDPEIVLALPVALQINVSLPRRENESGDDLLILWCGGFTSNEEAQSIGTRVKMAVMLTGVLLGVGTDVGNDQVISERLHRKDNQPDDRLQPDVHGLQIVPDIAGLIFGGFRVGRPVTRVSPAQLQKTIVETYSF